MTAVPIPPADDERTETHVLRSDFLNVVGSPSVGAVEVEVVVDANGGLRFYVVAP